jgi:hypothetical protein
MNTYRNTQYSITTSLNGHAIHLKIANNISYAFYEGSFDGASFKHPFELKDTYELINKCFARFVENPADKKYSVAMELDNSTLLLRFHCVVEGFLTVSFELRMREKIMSNDAQLTINFQRQQQTIDLLMQRVEEMEKIISALGSEIQLVRQSNGTTTTHTISETTLTLSGPPVYTPDSYKKIKHFYKLNRLSLIGLDGSHGPQTSITNASVKILTITNCAAFANFEYIKNFPNLEEFTMTNCTLSANAENTLKTTKHNIKKICLSSYGATFNVAGLQAYCSQNRIELTLS